AHDPAAPPPGAAPGAAAERRETPRVLEPGGDRRPSEARDLDGRQGGGRRQGRARGEAAAEGELGVDPGPKTDGGKAVLPQAREDAGHVARPGGIDRGRIVVDPEARGLPERPALEEDRVVVGGP